VPIVIVTITAMSKCTAYSYCDNNGEVYIFAMLAIIVTIMTITGRSICSAIN